MRDYGEIWVTFYFWRPIAPAYFDYTIWADEKTADDNGQNTLEGLQISFPPAEDWSLLKTHGWLKFKGKDDLIGVFNNARASFDPRQDPHFDWSDQSPRKDGYNSRTEDPSDPEFRGAGAGRTPKPLKLQEISVLAQLTQIYQVLIQKPNPDRALKALIAEIQIVMADLTEKRATQAEIDKVFADLQVLAT